MDESLVAADATTAPAAQVDISKQQHCCHPRYAPSALLSEADLHGDSSHEASGPGYGSSYGAHNHNEAPVRVNSNEVPAYAFASEASCYGYASVASNGHNEDSNYGSGQACFYPHTDNTLQQGVVEVGLGFHHKYQLSKNDWGSNGEALLGFFPDSNADTSGEREGIGGWILEEGQQENVTLVREERAGFGGWISDSAENSKEESAQCSSQRDDATESDIQTLQASEGTSDKQALQASEGTSDKQASSVASTSRRRRSRWEPQPPEAGEGQEASESGKKRRKSRWSAEESKPLVQLPDFVKELTGGMELDPELQGLNIKLLDVKKKLQTGHVLEDMENGMRLPSPEPVYDNFGTRINFRDCRARERLIRDRQEIITEMLRKNPAFKPPPDYRPPKLYKKLFIPMKEYPGYNFIGLIIGPRGNTQKRMERETGAKIVIRGKGSAKEGRLGQKRDMWADPGENEELHVLIEADNADSLERAVRMVEKLLVPVDEGLNEHKRAQLRELAALNGTFLLDEVCRLCGEHGHRQYTCSARNSIFKSDVACRICGDGAHPTIDCPLKSSGLGKMDDEYKSFLAELGGGTEPFNGAGACNVASSAQSGTILALPISQGGNPPWVSSEAGSCPGGTTVLPTLDKGGDVLNVYVGYLPLSMDDDGLIRLFSPFGKIDDLKLIKDRVTGVSKGYGFVKFSDTAAATQAVLHLNGYRLDGKVLAVSIAGKSSSNAAGAQAMSVNQQQQPQPQQEQQQLPRLLPPSPLGLMGPSPPWSTQQAPSRHSYGPFPPVPLQGSAPMLSNGGPHANAVLQQLPLSSAPDVGSQRPPGSIPKAPPPSISEALGNMPRPGGVLTDDSRPTGSVTPSPGGHYGAPPTSTAAAHSFQSTAPSRWAHAINMVSSSAPPKAQQNGGVESEYEKFMSEMGR
ncbi:hypothetical protein L7F22_037866 [Adiantum nelumboides]|nr:hypothetical protein [Adiantum nelumboides]